MKRSVVKKGSIFIFCVGLVFFAVFPFLQMLSVSLKNPIEWGNPNLIPKVITFSAYEELLGGKGEVNVEELPSNVKKILDNPKLSNAQRKEILKKYSQSKGFPFGRYMLNSFALAIGASLCSLVVSVLGAYAVSRLKFRGQSIMQRGILFVYLLGGVVIMVPLYQIATRLHLTSSGVGVVFTLLLIYILQTLPLSLYMLGNYMRGLPFSLEEAAQIDGCSRIGIILKIIVPLSRPIIATVFIYCFIIAWNEYLYASVFLKNTPDLFTIPIGIRTLFVSKNAIWARIMAASILTLTPILLFFGVLSNNLQKGMVEGGVKE